MEPIYIRSDVQEYRDLVLTLMRGDFAAGQRWFAIEDTETPTTISSFAEGQEGMFSVLQEN